MEVRLNVLVVDKGVLTRHEFRLPNTTTEGFDNSTDYTERFDYGSEDPTDGKDMVKVWYTFALEPHEREERLKNK